MMIKLQKRTFAIGGVVLIVAVTAFLLFDTLRPKTQNWVTAMVERGDVTELVSVSGFVEAKNTAQLAFPSPGVVTEVFVQEGDEVVAGEVLATLASSELVAQRNEAEAGLQLARAQYDKLLAGAGESDRSVAEISVHNAQEELERTITLEDEKVENARRTLLSEDLEALSVNPIENATAPSVTGTYTCENSGVYTLEVYASNAYTGYSYHYSGLEEGVSSISTDQPTPLGSCGLYLQFTDGDNYGTSKWTIDIPNTRSSSYVANANAYELAKQQRDNAIDTAEDTLNLTAEESAGVSEGPTSEERREAQAAVDQAKARIAAVDAQLRDRSIVAPFSGVVTDIGILRGETALSAPVVTVLASDAFELIARIPEIDITKVAEKQAVQATFDAQQGEVQTGTITYVSPVATLIDGVAYFEATITLSTLPSWIRSGLNADVDIVINKKENVLRIPKRFLIENEDGTLSVKIPKGGTTATTTVTLQFAGNDGFIEVTGLNEGDTVIAP